MGLDVRGLACPQPLLKAKKALHGLEVGEELRVLTTDLSSAMDFETFCRAQGHRLLWVRESEGTYICLIEKG
jgi:tRNA 2-thiouridine synthesizing protein A